MNQPWIYMCSPSWSPLLPPSPSNHSGSSQCTSPEHLSHASNLGWWSASPLIVYLFQCYFLRTSHPSVFSWRLHITNSWDAGAAKCPLRYLWLAFSIIYQVSPFLVPFFLHSLSFPMSLLIFFVLFPQASRNQSPSNSFGFYHFTTIPGYKIWAQLSWVTCRLMAGKAALTQSFTYGLGLRATSTMRS